MYIKKLNKEKIDKITEQMKMLQKEKNNEINATMLQALELISDCCKAHCTGVAVGNVENEEIGRCSECVLGKTIYENNDENVRYTLCDFFFKYENIIPFTDEWDNMIHTLKKEINDK